MLAKEQYKNLCALFDNTNLVAMIMVALVSIDYISALGNNLAVSEIHPLDLLFSGRLCAWYIIVCYSLIKKNANALVQLTMAAILPDLLYLALHYSEISHMYEFVVVDLATVVLALGSYVFGYYQRLDFALEISVFTGLLATLLLYSPLVNITDYWQHIVEDMTVIANNPLRKELVIHTLTSNLMLASAFLPMLILWVSTLSWLSKFEKGISIYQQQWLNYHISHTAYILALGVVLFIMIEKIIALNLNVKIPWYYFGLQISIYNIVSFIPATGGLSLLHCILASHYDKQPKQLLYKILVGILFISFVLIRDIFVCIGLVDKLMDCRARYNIKLSLQH